MLRNTHTTRQRVPQYASIAWDKARLHSAEIHTLESEPLTDIRVGGILWQMLYLLSGWLIVRYATRAVDKISGYQIVIRWTETMQLSGSTAVHVSTCRMSFLERGR